MSGHDHDHHHHDHSELSETELRVRALETVLTEKGYVDPAALDLLIETYEKKVGPRNGARVVAKAWVDPSYRARLLKDATPAIGELSYAGRQGEHIVALENTPKLHNMVVCTLCSCYPWPVLGLPPVWYKSAPYRSRAVSDPRGVLADFGVTLPKDTEIRVWDSTAEIRYLVLPQRPIGTEGWSEEKLADLVTRDSMIGTGLPKRPEDFEVNGGQDLGGAHGHGPVLPEPNEPVFHADWEKRAFALTLAMGRPGAWNIDMSRFARENRPPREYLSMSYYELWFYALETMLKERDLVSDGEIVAGHALAAPKPVKQTLSVGDVAQVLYRGGPTERDTNTTATFKPGDRVRAKNINPVTHTRLPRYVRGRVGTVERVIGCHVFPDSNAAGGGENPQWLYTVRFDGPELWGEGSDPSVKVSVDAWEPYLEPA